MLIAFICPCEWTSCIVGIIGSEDRLVSVEGQNDNVNILQVIRKMYVIVDYVSDVLILRLLLKFRSYNLRENISTINGL